MINQEKIIARLAEKYKLSKFVAKEIVESQFRFLQKTIETSEHKGVRLHKLGVFMCKPGRIKHLDEVYAKVKARKEEEHGQITD